MKKNLSGKSVILGALLGALCLSGMTARSETPAEWSTLTQGQVLVKEIPAPNKNTLPSVEARILIPRPPEKVWPVVANPEKLMATEQKVKKVKILSQAGNKQDVEFNVLMTRLLPSFNYVLRQELAPPHMIRFYRVSGSFKDVQGAWKLIPADQGQKTILSYTLKLDPGPMVPRSMLLGAVKADLPTMMQNAKKAIDRY